MKTYPTVREMLSELKSLPADAIFYYDFDRWCEHPLMTPILYLSIAEEEEMDVVETPHDHLPRMVAERGMRRFFDVETMRDIVTVQARNHPDSSTDDYVRAIIHYAEYDSFLPQ